MKIIIDTREQKLYNLLSTMLNDNSDWCKLEVNPLDIGDIHIIDEDTKEYIIFERKTLADLVSSISDGRYNEQSFRLQSTPVHNHNIFYIIEGNIKTYRPYKSHIKNSTIYSSIFTLSYYKGFSVYRTDDIHETAVIISRIADKLYRENKSGKRTAFFKNNSSHDESDNKSEDSSSDYTKTLKTQKKSFITKDNIAKIMLMQIPNVSNNFAHVITMKYNTIIDLICALQEDDKCLDNITYTTSSGKSRKISKTCVKNIKDYLLNET